MSDSSSYFRFEQTVKDITTFYNRYETLDLPPNNFPSQRMDYYFYATL